MPTELRSPRLAVLIDADNASAKIVDGLFEEIAKIGEASVRRIYGDFSNPRSKGWADTLSKHAIIPQQQFAYTTGKNASDITLVIDAMDLLHSGRFDGFCLVSSDSDFTRLAARIREQGVDVFGFGEQKTPESFRQACRRFVCTENLLAGAANSQDAASTSKPLQPPSAATPIIKKVITQMESEDGWVPLGEVGKQLANLASDFDPNMHSHKDRPSVVYFVQGTDTVIRDDGTSKTFRRRQSPAWPDQAHQQTHRSPGPDCPRPNSHPTARETKCSDRGHRQRQSASSNPPAKSQENHITGRRFHTAWTQLRHRT
jgi:hypothetical protein